MLLIGRIKPGELVRFCNTAEGRTTGKLRIGKEHRGCRTYSRVLNLGGGMYSYISYDYSITVYNKGIIFKGPYAVAKPHVDDWDETRVDIIGQNGNDGLHYPLRDS